MTLLMVMTERRICRVYDLWSKLYDRTFVVVAHKRQHSAIAQLHLSPGDRVLDLGVGTGSTLSRYPEDVCVVGVDLSRGMLSQAAEKRTNGRLDHCELIQGDAMYPPFADASFDHIIISHTISVVSDPLRVMQWAARLVRPGGRVVVLNHFQSTRPVLAVLGKALNPLCMWMGWRSDLALEALLQNHDLQLEYCFQQRIADLWTIVVLSRPPAHARRGWETGTLPEQDEPSDVCRQATVGALSGG